MKPDLKATKKTVTLTNKVATLEKKLAEVKAEAVKAKEKAENQCNWQKSKLRLSKPRKKLKTSVLSPRVLKWSRLISLPRS